MKHRWGPVAGSCEQVDEHSGFIKGGKFLYEPSNCIFSSETLLPGVS